MHLIYQGVYKRLLEFLIGRGNRAGLLTEAEVNELSNTIDEILPWIPSDFNRKHIRNFEFFSKFKVTELRRMLFYDSLVLLCNIRPSLWKCFLLLHAGTYILASPTLVLQYADLANTFLRQFVKVAAHALGKHFVVYNVHSIIHVAEECRNHGHLDNFGAFKYENFLGTVRKILRSTYKPLQQLARRDKETKGHLAKPKSDLKDREIILSLPHSRDNNIVGEQYFSIELGGKAGTVLKVAKADSCFKTKAGDIAILTNVIKSPEGEIFLAGHKFSVVEDYYDYPCPSSLLGIHKVSSLEEEERRWKLSKYCCKCVLLPCSETAYVSIPLLHC